MPSRDLDLDTTAARGSGAGALSRLLDLAFGLFIWAIHFLVVYVGAAVACVLGVGTRNADARSTVVAALVAVTLLAAAIVVWHAVRTYRRTEPVPDPRFVVGTTVGLDALSALAILWQLFPILMVPLCR
jgi:hypothetical protein